MKKLNTTHEKIQALINRKKVKQIIGENYVLSKKQKEELEEYFSVYDFNNNKVLLLAHFLKYNLTDFIYRQSELEKTKGDNTSKKSLILRYGDKEGKKRFNEYSKKQAYSNSFEYKKKKHKWTKKQFDDFNKSRAVTIDNMIARHGEILGLQKWEEYCDQQAFTNTLDYFINREGSTEKGLNVYKNLNREKAKAGDPNWIMKKYNVSFDEALEIKSSRLGGKHVSDAEKIFIDELETTLCYSLQYTYKTSQFCKWFHDYNQPVFFDIADTFRKKIIEFNGDYWHANPKIYESTYIIKQSGKKAEDIWEFDNKKRQLVTKIGFKVMTVWESEYKNNNEKTIQQIIQWWNDD